MLNMLFDEIVERENEFVKYCETWNGQNICLFGAGEGARRIFYYLKRRAIDVKKIAVNQRYIETARERAIGIWRGDKCHVDSFEDLMKSGIIYDVIVCFSGWDIAYFRNFKNVREIINLDVFSGLPALGEISSISYSYYYNHANELEYVYSKLADDKSKKCFASYINQRISGKYKYADGLIDKEQYFDEGIFKFHDNECFVDCGAFDGSDTQKFFIRTNSDSKAILFEADIQNIRKINGKLSQFQNRYQIINKAALDKTCFVKFQSDGNMDSKISDEGDISVECTTIDDCIKKEIITYLKMDIEGAELRALQGAKETIMRYTPRLAICVYHKPEDLYEIPNYILSLNPNYQLYLRRYDELCIETVLFAV